MADHDTHDHTGVPGAGSPTEILDIPTAEMDDTLVLAPDGAGGVEFRAESGGGAGTAILLTFDLASDHSGAALTAGAAFDIISNQNFTVASASSIVEVSVMGMGFCNSAVSNQYVARANIDSGGTPVIRYMGGANNINTTANDRANVLACAPVFVSGLTAAVHTIKIQLVALSNNDTFFCRASTNGPLTGGEFMRVQVIEHS